MPPRRGVGPSFPISPSWRVALVQRQPSIRSAIFPDALPHINEHFFLSILVGPTHLHWALHQGYQEQGNKPLHFWKTRKWPTVHNMKSRYQSPSDALAHHVPFHLHHYFFGGTTELPEAATKENAWRCSWERTIPMIHVYILNTLETSAKTGPSHKPLTLLFSEQPSQLYQLSAAHFWRNQTAMRREPLLLQQQDTDESCDDTDQVVGGPPTVAVAFVEDSRRMEADNAICTITTPITAVATLPHAVSPDTSFASRQQPFRVCDNANDYSSDDDSIADPTWRTPHLFRSFHESRDMCLEDDASDMDEWDDRKPAAQVMQNGSSSSSSSPTQAAAEATGIQCKNSTLIESAQENWNTNVGVARLLSNNSGNNKGSMISLAADSPHNEEGDVKVDSMGRSAVLDKNQERHVIVTNVEKESMSRILQQANVDVVACDGDIDHHVAVMATTENQFLSNTIPSITTTVFFAIGQMVYDEQVQHQDVERTFPMERIRHDLLGSRVAVQFETPQPPDDDVWYRGSVIKISRGIDEERNWKECLDDDLYSVLFDDGDGQELNPFEMYRALMKYYELGERDIECYDNEEERNMLKRQMITKSKVNGEQLLSHSIMVQESVARAEANRAWKARNENLQNNSEEDAAAFVGKRIAKKFDDGNIYFGTVTRFETLDPFDANGETLWWITYDDTETEQFDLKDLQNGIRLYETTTTPTTRKRIQPEKEASGLSQASKSIKADAKSVEFVGQRVARKFDDDNIYCGTVTSFVPADPDDPNGESLWWIAYDDTETEQFDLKDLKKGLQLYATTTATSSRKRITRNRVATEPCRTSNVNKSVAKSAAFVGRRVAKRFDDGQIYCGTVSSSTRMDPDDPNGKTLWWIVFDDRECEQFDLKAVQKGLRLYLATTTASSRKRMKQDEATARPSYVRRVNKTDAASAAFVGMRVAKRFGDGYIYFGTVSGFTPADADDPQDENLWWITYDDTETEQFDLQDVQKGLRLYKTTFNVGKRINPKERDAKLSSFVGRCVARTADDGSVCLGNVKGVTHLNAGDKNAWWNSYGDSDIEQVDHTRARLGYGLYTTKKTSSRRRRRKHDQGKTTSLAAERWRRLKAELACVVGRRVARTFDDGYNYFGTVTSFAPADPGNPNEENLWWINYDDTETEQFDLTDLQKGLRLFWAITSSSSSL